MSSEIWKSLDVTYEGNYDKRGKLSGPGRLIYKNGIVIEGNFANEQLNGDAVVILPDSSRYTAVFKNGIEVPGTASYAWEDGLTMTLSVLSESTRDEVSEPPLSQVSQKAEETNDTESQSRTDEDANDGNDESLEEKARAEWLYLHPHDRRLWNEHKTDSKANIHVNTKNMKSETDIVLGPY